jgi:hypothetical protein
MLEVAEHFLETKTADFDPLLLRIAIVQCSFQC